MDKLNILYDKNREKFYELLKSSRVRVTPKIGGTTLQAVWDDAFNKVRFYKKPINGEKIGSVVDKLSKLFVGEYSYGIKTLQNHLDLLAQYSVVTFKVLEDYIILLSVTTKDGTEANDEMIKTLASHLECMYVPVLFDDALTDVQQEAISMWMDSFSANDDLLGLIEDIFDIEDNETCDNISKYLTGIVLQFFNDKNKEIGKYKILELKSNNVKAESKAQYEKDFEKYNKVSDELIKVMANWLENNAERLGSTVWDSKDGNFIEMMNDPKMYNKIINLASQLPVSIQDPIDEINEKIRKRISTGGMPVYIAYETYAFVFTARKYNSYVISKDFQERVNNIISKFEQ